MFPGLTSLPYSCIPNCLCHGWECPIHYCFSNLPMALLPCHFAEGYLLVSNLCFLSSWHIHLPVALQLMAESYMLFCGNWIHRMIYCLKISLLKLWSKLSAVRMPAPTIEKMKAKTQIKSRKKSYFTRWKVQRPSVKAIYFSPASHKGCLQLIGLEMHPILIKPSYLL